MIAVIDNYDSFTYNIVQYLGELGAELEIFRNDAISVSDLAARQPAKLVISPGPGTPADAGISVASVDYFKNRIPILGICLGHQSIGQVFGGNIIHAKQIMHGKLSRIHHNGVGVFAGLEASYTVTRYHSLVIDPATLPECLELTAWTGESHQPANAEQDLVGHPEFEIMGIRHKEYAIEGVQFHPESISSEHGHALLKNFVDQ